MLKFQCDCVIICLGARDEGLVLLTQRPHPLRWPGPLESSGWQASSWPSQGQQRAGKSIHRGFYSDSAGCPLAGRPWTNALISLCLIIIICPSTVGVIVPKPLQVGSRGRSNGVHGAWQGKGATSESNVQRRETRLLVQQVPGWEALKSTCMWASYPTLHLQGAEQYMTQD